MPKRASQLEMQQRLDTVLALLIRGLTTSQLIQGLMKHFDFGQRQAYRYLKLAKAQLLQMSEKPQALRAINALRREHLYTKAMEEKDYRLAHKIIDSGEKLFAKQGGGKTVDSTHALEPGELEAILAKFTEQT